MAKRTTKSKDEPVAPRRAPAKTLEARENQLISLAMDVAEQQMRDGTASSQIITEFLKRGSTEERLKKEIMHEQHELLKAKTESIKSAATVEELYKNALSAMRKYSGSNVEEDYDH